MAEPLDRGYFGEQGAGFFLGAEGYYFVEGPSGAGGHTINASGFDGVAFNPRTRMLIIYDNKAYRASGNVGSGTAIDPLRNLTINLGGLITRVQGMSDLPDQKIILEALQATRNGIASGAVTPPPNVKIAISNFGGNSKGVSGPIGSRGIQFIDMARDAPTVPSRGSYVDRTVIAEQARRMPVVDADYMRRIARGEAIAMAVAMAAQFLNDLSLQHAMDLSIEQWSGPILRCQTQQLGSLLIYTIATIPMAMVTSRHLESVEMSEGRTPREAYMKWKRSVRLDQVYGDHVVVELGFRWIGPIAPSP